MRIESTGGSGEARVPLELPGTLSLFGFPSTIASLEVIPRSPAWRGTRASAYFGSCLILAPLLGMLPPHAPWVAGVLAFGGYFGVRKWRERFTLVSLSGPCPKCGGGVTVRSGTPLRPGLSIPCEGCHHDSQLSVTLPSHLPESGEGGEG